MKLLALVTSALKGAKALGGLSALLAAVSVIPGVGIAGTVFAAVGGALTKIVKAFFEGVSICVANPVVLTVLVVTFGGGVWAGIDFMKHKVEVANAKVTALKDQWKSADEDAERRLVAALAAREAAEKAAKANEERAARSAADARRLRKLASKPASPAPGGQSLPWVSSVLGTR